MNLLEILSVLLVCRGKNKSSANVYWIVGGFAAPLHLFIFWIEFMQ
jgi:hypothetical protein